jgi:mRNA interferase MazF
MNAGDVVWVSFPAGAGRAQAGRRPGIILQTDHPGTHLLPTVLVVPLTSQLASLRFPGTSLVEPNATNGLRQPSVALVFQLTAIDRTFVEASFGKVSREGLANLYQCLDEVMGRA